MALTEKQLSADDDSEVPADAARFSAKERREGRERRELTVGTFFKGSLKPRRRGDRRHDDGYVVDWHEPDLLILAVSILMLSVIDAFFTLTLLRHGATEANPFLDYILTQHPAMFAMIKMGFTGGGVLILVAMARARVFRVLRVKTVLQCTLLGYIVLFGYEMWLLRDIF